MRQYQLRLDGKTFYPELVSVPQPQLRPGEVLLQMQAWSLNYRDLLVLDAKSTASRQGLVPVSDGVGVVVEVGPGAQKFRLGDRVANTFFRDWVSGGFDARYIKSAFGGDTPGVLSEFVALPESALVRIGDELSSTQAATLPCAAVTAWHALFPRANINEESVVLIQGTGGVSLFGLQFCLAVGAQSVITSSSDEKLQRARSLGANHLVNYVKHPEWDEEVLRVTEGEGVTHVLEIGGPDTFPKSLKVLAAGGTIAQIGVITGFGSTANLMRLQSINANIVGISVGSRHHLEATLDFVIQKRIQPVIDKTFAFDDAPAAFDYLRTGSHFGKVVVEI